MAHQKMSERVTLQLADESNETLSKIDSNTLSDVSPGLRFISDHLRLLRTVRCLAHSIEKKILLARSFPVRYAVRALIDALGSSPPNAKYNAGHFSERPAVRSASRNIYIFPRFRVSACKVLGQGPRYRVGVDGQQEYTGVWTGQAWAARET